MLKIFSIILYLIGLPIFIYGVLMENHNVKLVGLIIWAVGVIPQLLNLPKTIKSISGECKVYNPKNGELRMKRIPESAQHPKVLKLYAGVGEFVKKDDLLMEVETNKVILEVTSPISAKIKSLHVSSGKEVSSSDLLITFEV